MSKVMHMHVEPELREPVMVLAFEGWNDAGESATAALHFLNDSIHSVPLAEMDPEKFYDFTVRRPNVVALDDATRRIDWPRNEFRFGSIDGDRELIIGIGIEPHLRWRKFCDSIIDLALDQNVSRVVLAGAYLADVVYSQPVSLTGYCSERGALNDLGILASAYQGPTGIVGVLGDHFQREGIPVLSLWAGLPHYIEASPNPRGALALVQKIMSYLDFRIDDQPLRAAAAEFEERISKVVASDSELAEYVKRLKRREFAQ